MDTASADRLFKGFVEIYLDAPGDEGKELDSLRHFVLNPLCIAEEVVVFGCRVGGRWAGATLSGATNLHVSGVDVWRTSRLQHASELWSYRSESKEYEVRAALWVLELEEGDVLTCQLPPRMSTTQKADRAVFEWRGGRLVAK